MTVATKPEPTPAPLLAIASLVLAILSIWVVPWFTIVGTGSIDVMAPTVIMLFRSPSGTFLALGLGCSGCC